MFVGETAVGSGTSSIGVSGERQSASELARAAAEAEDFRLYQAHQVSAERIRQSVREAEQTLDVSLGQTVGQQPPQRQVQKVQQHEKVATPQKEVQQEKIYERTHDHSIGIGF